MIRPPLRGRVQRYYCIIGVRGRDIPAIDEEIMGAARIASRRASRGRGRDRNQVYRIAVKLVLFCFRLFGVAIDPTIVVVLDDHFGWGLIAEVEGEDKVRSHGKDIRMRKNRKPPLVADAPFNIHETMPCEIKNHSHMDIGHYSLWNR